MAWSDFTSFTVVVVLSLEMNFNAISSFFSLVASQTSAKPPLPRSCTSLYPGKGFRVGLEDESSFARFSFSMSSQRNERGSTTNAEPRTSFPV